MTIFTLTLDNLSEALPVLRARFGLTQMKTAEGVGISFQAYNPIELGKVRPRYETFEKLKKFFQSGRPQKNIMPGFPWTLISNDHS